MGKIIYVTGGARSGKSTFAEKLVNEISEVKENKIYVATSIPFDEEMQSRVEKHKIQRGNNWKTIESYKNIKDNIENLLVSEKIDKGVVLIDCMTILVTNFILEDRSIDWDQMNIPDSIGVDIEERIKKEVLEILDYAKSHETLDFVMVSNEVGLGLVPEFPLGRIFRDIAGRVNQLLGEYGSEVYMVISGLPLRLK